MLTAIALVPYYVGVFAEFETNPRRERQMEGTQAAKARGVYKGGKVRIDPEAVRRLAAEGVKPAHIAGQLGISRGTVYRCLPVPREGGPGSNLRTATADGLVCL